MRLHKNFSEEDWSKRSLEEQMSNIGSEIERALDFEKKKDKKMKLASLYRGFELLYYTIEDDKNKDSLKELCRLYEMLGEYFIGDNLFGLTEMWIRKYFRFFMLAYVKRKQLGKN